MNKDEKRSRNDLKRVVEQAVSEVCRLPRRGLLFCVDEVEANGRPPDHLKVWATLHFLSAGSPFCCGEPGCHLGLFDERIEEVSATVRRVMSLQNDLLVDFGERINAKYHSGVAFTSGGGAE